MRVHILRAFIIYPLVHIHQKKKIALEIAAKTASVNKPLITNRVSARLNMQLHTIVVFVCVSLFPIREFEQDNEI